MAELVTTSVSFSKWTLTTEADIDACAEELFTAHRIASNVVRAWDEQNADIRRLEIHAPDPTVPTLTTAVIGNIVILLNGVTEALTPEQYASRGYSG